MGAEEGGASVVPRSRPTSADVARRAGVSRTTVSFVLNERRDVRLRPETRRRVLAAAAELGYRPHGPARQLAVGESQAIGLVLIQRPEQIAADGLLAETLRGLGAAAQGAGYRVLLEPHEPGSRTYLDLIAASHVDGLVISGPRSDDPGLAELARAGRPVVIQGAAPGVACPSVDVDNEAGARRAVEHLLELGHVRIGCITNAPLGYTSAAERLAGYRAALRSAGLDPTAEHVAEGAFDPASGAAAMAQLLDADPDLTAVFVASDVVALGAIAAARARGRRIPTDLSVVGFDDIPLAAHFDPPLTTIRVPAYDLGLSVGRALIERIAGRPVAERTLLPIELVVRGSTGPPPRRARRGER
jgi:DNA-binding LacI/PurR family transcriptional regulator